MVKTAKLADMDIATLQHEIEALPDNQQDRLAAFLTALRLKRDGMLSEIGRRLDQRDSENWRKWEDVKADLDYDFT